MIFSHLEATKLISEVALIGLENFRPLVVRDYILWRVSSVVLTGIAFLLPLVYFLSSSTPMSTSTIDGTLLLLLVKSEPFKQ